MQNNANGTMATGARIWTVAESFANAIKRRQCVKLSVRIFRMHFPFSNAWLLLRPKQRKRTKAKPRHRTPPFSWIRRRGCVYNLRFMWAMLTGREWSVEWVAGAGKQQRLTRAVRHLMRLTNTYTQAQTPTKHTHPAHPYRQTHTPQLHPKGCCTMCQMSYVCL